MPSAVTVQCSQCQAAPANIRCIAITCRDGCSGSAWILDRLCPLSQYNESTLYSDFLFLNSISRSSQAIGKEIVKMNMLPPPPAASTPGGPNAIKPRPDPTSSLRQTNAQRQKEQLRKQIGFRRLNIMLLPDGMKARKLNQTTWNHKEKAMRYSVEVRFGCGTSKGAETAASGSRDGPGPAPAAQDDEAKDAVKISGVQEVEAPRPDSKDSQDSALLHRVDGERPVDHIVLDELERRSFTRKEIKTMQFEQAASTSQKAWYLSRALLRRLGLAVPPSQVALKEDAAQHADAVVITAMPDDWRLLVSLHDQRLRNESTTRYLEWWTRKQEYEKATRAREEAEAAAAAAAEAKAAAAAAKRAKGRGSKAPRSSMPGVPTGPKSMADSNGAQPQPPLQQPQREMRTWGAPEAAVEAQQQPGASASSPPASLATTSAGHNSIIPAHILSQLSSLHQTAPPPAAAPAPAARLSKSPPIPARTALPSVATQLAPAAASPTAPPPAATAPSGRTTAEDAATVTTTTTSKPYLVVPSSPAKTIGIERLLQTLPPDYAVVEYATLHLWNAHDVDEAIAQGRIRLVEARHGGGEDGGHGTGTSAATGGNGDEVDGGVRKRKWGVPAAEAQAEEGDEKKVKTDPTRAAPASVPSSSVGGGQKGTLTALVAYDSSSSDIDEDEEAEEDEDEGREDAGSTEDVSTSTSGGLASLARSIGFHVGPPSRSLVSPAPAPGAETETAMPMPTPSSVPTDAERNAEQAMATYSILQGVDGEEDIDFDDD
ncbi:uncharacterized protein PSFLO_03354 [Pseudozyma flocculosa]|uniref:BCD1 alpha/beta domain-containing protein n=1 Tax=Pseudozyma flocculosa TaxID=84751 RepID=A0A5C3F2C3_9BASI|nr:uncharacterized protein PSFLO_03354 [Pseudozyma flocculosa]